MTIQVFQNKVSVWQQVRRTFAFKLARLARRVLLLTGRRATSFPGRLALRLYPAMLEDLCYKREIILVTGTNGKSSSCHYLTALLEADGQVVISNRSGANMPDGIVSSFLAEPEKLRQEAVRIVMEIDEAWFAKVSHRIQAKSLLLTNIFTDQVDRYGDRYATRDLLLKGLQAVPDMALVTCADEPLVASLSTQHEPAYLYGLDVFPPSATQAVDFSCPLCRGDLQYRAGSYLSLGDYICPVCGFKRPQPDLAFSWSPDHLTLHYAGQEETLTFPDLALYQAYNMAGAILQAIKLGVSPDLAVTLLPELRAVRGRDSVLHLSEGRRAVEILVKNQAGYSVAFNKLLTRQDGQALFFTLNNTENDGVDISWIQQVDFSVLQAVEPQLHLIMVSGSQAFPLAERLRQDGINPDIIQVEPLPEHAWQKLLKVLAPGETVYMLPNYSAMLQLRPIVKPSVVESPSAPQ